MFPIETLPVPVPIFVTDKPELFRLIVPVTFSPPVPEIRPVPESTPTKVAAPDLAILAVSVAPLLTTKAFKFAPVAPLNVIKSPV